MASDIDGQMPELEQAAQRIAHPVANDPHSWSAVFNAAKHELTHFRASGASEPVAWRARHADGDEWDSGWVLLHTRRAADNYAKQPDTVVEPLYATPKAGASEGEWQWVPKAWLVEWHIDDPDSEPCSMVFDSEPSALRYAALQLPDAAIDKAIIPLYAAPPPPRPAEAKWEDALAMLAQSEDLLAFHEGTAEPHREGAEPSVCINGEDFIVILRGVRAALSAMPTPDAVEELKPFIRVANSLLKKGHYQNRKMNFAVWVGRLVEDGKMEDPDILGTDDFRNLLAAAKASPPSDSFHVEACGAHQRHIDELESLAGELARALEASAEALAVSLDRLGVGGHGDGQERKADADSYGATSVLDDCRKVLRRARAAGILGEEG